MVMDNSHVKAITVAWDEVEGGQRENSNTLAIWIPKLSYKEYERKKLFQ